MTTLLIFLIALVLATGCSNDDSSDNRKDPLSIINPDSINGDNTLSYDFAGNCAGGDGQTINYVIKRDLTQPPLIGGTTPCQGGTWQVQDIDTSDITEGDLIIEITLGDLIRTTTIIKDITTPSLLGNIEVPTNGTYGKDERLNFELTFDEPIVVKRNPYITLTLGTITQNAEYISGENTAVLTLSYTVQQRDFDSDGIELDSAIQLNGGSIADAAGNEIPLINLTFPTLSGILLDGAKTAIFDVSASSSHHKENEPIVLTAQSP